MSTPVVTDLFTTGVWTWGELVTYDVVFFIDLGGRRVYITGTTTCPNEPWMMQIARNMTIAN
jgi:putative transposase